MGAEVLAGVPGWCTGLFVVVGLLTASKQQATIEPSKEDIKLGMPGVIQAEIASLQLPTTKAND